MEFGNLNEHLIASIYPVDRSGSSGGDGIQAMVTEATMEVQLGWQSPFEALGPEAVSPTLLAMVQSGEAEKILGEADGVFGSALGVTSSALDWLAEKVGFSGGAGSVADMQKSGVGRTGLTKMNSTQVFTGMPPIKINATLLFRAWSDPSSEVEEPFNTLMGWALPQCLQADSILAQAVSGSSKCDAAGSGTALDALLPSTSPQMVGLTYKARSYKPLVIETVGFPMDSPSDSGGRYVELLVPVSFATWQTFDANDWAGISSATASSATLSGVVSKAVSQLTGDFLSFVL